MFNYNTAEKPLNRQPSKTLQFHDIMKQIPDERVSEQSECTVNPAQQSAVYTIKVASKNKYLLKSESHSNTKIVHHSQNYLGSTLPSVE